MTLDYIIIDEVSMAQEVCLQIVLNSKIKEPKAQNNVSWWFSAAYASKRQSW